MKPPFLTRLADALAWPPRCLSGTAAACLLALCSAGTGASPVIYTCVDDKGRRHNADRPVAACLDREQRMLNRDGSARGVLPPHVSAQQQAELAALAREQALAQRAREEAARRDRLLLSRYPTPGAHAQARQAALGLAQPAEHERIHRRFDAEDERLRPLWAAAPARSAAGDTGAGLASAGVGAQAGGDPGMAQGTVQGDLQGEGRRAAASVAPVR